MKPVPVPVPDPVPWYSTTLNLWTLAGVLVACWTLTKALTEGWRRTIGRRRYVTARLRKIAPGVRHDYVESLLNKPKWQSTMQATRLAPGEQPEGGEEDEQKVELTVRTWLLSRLCYLVTWCEDDIVVMYGIATTSWWFRPWMRVGETRIRLGKSTFAAIPDRSTVNHRAWLGSRRYGYFEEHWFGNIGGYRSWYVGVNEFGYSAFPVSEDWFDDSDIRHTLLLPEPREAYRASTPINTVVVSGIALFAEVEEGTFFGLSLGVGQDLVRLAEPEDHVLDSRIGPNSPEAQGVALGAETKPLGEETTGPETVVGEGSQVAGTIAAPSRSKGVCHARYTR
ncbi:ETEC_3214 domain-containing protein [Streptomyces griseorubiginosus]|uniref:ETEC_3214 domain-containing protein n=1 Tax=Streptomyces griseorubiginosus TaxID=67304 RepID=UPI00215A2439|nr:ETEC_3214 domain-containing protein [Streptomyces griseorubiginosus]